MVRTRKRADISRNRGVIIMIHMEAIFYLKIRKDLLVYPSVRKSVKPPRIDINRSHPATLTNIIESLPRAIFWKAKSRAFI